MSYIFAGRRMTSSWMGIRELYASSMIPRLGFQLHGKAILFSYASIMDLKVILLAIFVSLSNGKEALYELALSDEDIFSACSDTKPGTLDVNGFLDLSELFTTLQEDGIQVSGNMTFVWDIQPQDRVKMDIKAFYFDRGTWKPTFAIIKDDFCKLMYDSSQLWYTYWTEHVINVEDVRDKCTYPGTKMIFEPYLMMPILNFTIIREGLYKVQFKWRGFDSAGKERPTNICFDVLGYVQQKKMNL
ncbi:uncharacterized protein LOC110184954 [Drosophila serrata]|uniref:uncharacterized protein LOC110184954 n=1 Tax=Drosophila serrata TaxID=7274 RepID=UPI000A1D11B0|nr:uncharacterized protein LOC110184954 [Drosophila serrata]